MIPSSRKKHPSNPSFAEGRLTSQSTQQPWPVCVWSARAPRTIRLPSPFPRHSHTLTATATATTAGELLLFGGYIPDCATRDLYSFSTRDFSTTLLQTGGEVPSPRCAHVAALIGTTLIICGGRSNFGNRWKVLNFDSLYLLNLGTSNLYLLMSIPTPTDQTFALQYRESGPGLRSMVPDRVVVTTIPQRWSVPRSLSSVVRPARRP
jgi:hypothetical protein